MKEIFLLIFPEYQQSLQQKGNRRRRLCYNGIEKQPLTQDLNLSDAFLEECGRINLEVAVKVINVNYEKGAELLKKCKTLEEYSEFIHMIRIKWRETGNRETAITESVEQCIKEGILTEFLKRNGGEIMSFVNIELTREECEAIREEDGYLRGLEEGEETGKLKEQRGIAVKMLQKGLDIKLIEELTGLSEKEIEALEK